MQKVVSISCGSVHVLALVADGTVYSWGQSSDGQVGDGPGAGPHQQANPMQVFSSNFIAKISAGDLTSFAV